MTETKNFQWLLVPSFESLFQGVNYEVTMSCAILHILETPEYCDVIKVHQYSAIMENACDCVLLYFDDVTLF